MARRLVSSRIMGPLVFKANTQLPGDFPLQDTQERPDILHRRNNFLSFLYFIEHQTAQNTLRHLVYSRRILRRKAIPAMDCEQRGGGR